MSSDLSLSQRRTVQREISREYRQWRRKLGREPRPGERKQIVAIAFAKARRVCPSIPERNPLAPLAPGFFTQEAWWVNRNPGGIIPAMVAGATGAVVSNMLQRNPGEPMLGELSQKFPGYVFFAFLAEPAASKFIEALKSVEVKLVADGGPNSKDIYVAQEDFPKAVYAIRRHEQRKVVRQSCRCGLEFHHPPILGGCGDLQRCECGRDVNHPPIPGPGGCRGCSRENPLTQLETINLYGKAFMADDRALRARKYGRPLEAEFQSGRADAMQSVVTQYGTRGAPVKENPHLEGEPCKLCGGPLGFLGQLGNLEHYQCRNCGAQFSVPTQEENPLTRDETADVLRSARRDLGYAEEGAPAGGDPSWYAGRATGKAWTAKMHGARTAAGERMSNRAWKFRNNPHLVIDSHSPVSDGSLGILSVHRGDPITTYRNAYVSAAGLASKLGRDIYIVAHPKVPSDWIPGGRVSRGFLMMGPYVSVTPDGKVIQENPLLMTVMGNPLNLDERQKLVSESSTDAQRARWAGREGNAGAEQYWSGQADAKGAVAERYAGYPSVNPARRRLKVGETVYVVEGSGIRSGVTARVVQPFDWRIESGAYKPVPAGYIYLQQVSDGSLFTMPRERLVAEDEGGRRRATFRGNPVKCNPRACDNPGHRPKTRVWKGFKGEWYWRVTNPHGATVKVPANGRARTERGAKRAANQCLRELVKKYGKKIFAKNPVHARRAGSAQPRGKAAPVRRNPGVRRRKVTMSLEKFARWLKKQNDPRLWADFRKKIEGYRKWTHGTMPKTVTVECVEKPGVNGIWLSYNAGKQPESLYAMPQGSKRKGAWRHKWETMPDMKNDPESGMILTKLRGKSRITDFLHK